MRCHAKVIQASDSQALLRYDRGDAGEHLVVLTIYDGDAQVEITASYDTKEQCLDTIEGYKAKHVIALMDEIFS